MTDDDEADSAALEAARSRLFGPPDDAAPREDISPPTTDDGDRAFARELFDSGN